MTISDFGYIALGIGLTVWITVAAMALGMIAAIPITMIAQSSWRPARVAIGLFIDVIRSIPHLVWIFIIYFGVPAFGVRFDSLTAAIIALGVISGAVISEIYRSALSGIGVGQREAGRALGFTRREIAVFILVPQMARVGSPTLATYMIALLKDSALASTIGVMEMTFRAGAIAERTAHGLPAFIFLGALYLVLSLPLALASRRVDARLRSRFAIS